MPFVVLVAHKLEAYLTMSQSLKYIFPIYET